MEYRASVCKRPGGKGWRGVLRWKDDTGQWHNTTKSFIHAATKAEAKRLTDNWLAEYQYQPTKELVVDYATRYVESKLALKAIQPSTATDYRKSINGWSPYLAGMLLKDLTPGIMLNAMTSMLEDVGVTTVRKRYVALNMVLDHAVKVGDLKDNPLDSVPRPKKEPSQPNPIVGDDLDRLKLRLATMKLQPWVVAVNLCLYAGLRAEETCGLQVGDIDLDNRIGWIRRAIGYARGGSYVAPPKNGKVRDFPICDQLADILAQWLEMRGGSPTDWLLSDEMMGVRKVGRMWSMLCDVEDFVGRAGRKPTLHDLRHTFATRCVACGMDIKTLQSILGHSSASVTLDIYASPDPAAKQAASALIGRAI